MIGAITGPTVAHGRRRFKQASVARNRAARGAGYRAFVARTFTRRELVVAGAGAAGLLALGGFGLSRVSPTPTARPSSCSARSPRRSSSAAARRDTWTYGAGIPGPELRLKQGERVRIRVENGLPEDTTVHWHGVRVENAIDGVPDMPLPPIKPGESFTYEFVPPDAGTYWFHPHVGMQLDRGLYGALIVERARRDARLRPRGRARARRLARRDRRHARREAEAAARRTACRCRAWT